MSQPTITIIHGRLLEPFFEPYAKEAKLDVISEEAIPEVLKSYRAAWSEVESKILSGIEEACNLTYAQLAIDVYIVRNLRGGMSDSMIISARPSSDRFVDLLTHELIHRVFSKNTENRNVLKFLEESYPNYDPKTRTHVGVHAVHAHIFRNVLKEQEREERDRKVAQKSEPYRTSWEIVDSVGYENILNSFRTY